MKPTFVIYVDTTRGPASISSNEEFNDLGAYTVEGPGKAIAQEWIEQAYGAFGHVIDHYAAPCDLHAAAMRLQNEPGDAVHFISCKGEVKQYDSGVPEGATT